MRAPLTDVHSVARSQAVIMQQVLGMRPPGPRDHEPETVGPVLNPRGAAFGVTS